MRTTPERAIKAIELLGTAHELFPSDEALQESKNINDLIVLKTKISMRIAAVYLAREAEISEPEIEEHLATYFHFDDPADVIGSHIINGDVDRDDVNTLLGYLKDSPELDVGIADYLNAEGIDISKQKNNRAHILTGFPPTRE